MDEDTKYFVQISGGLSFSCYDLSINFLGVAKTASTNTNVIAINELSVKAWPNPSDSSFNIKLTSNNSLDKVDIYVYDITNKLVHSNQFEPNQEYRFGKKLAGGIYTVKIIQSGKIKFIRLIKF